MIKKTFKFTHINYSYKKLLKIRNIIKKISKKTLNKNLSFTNLKSVKIINNCIKNIILYYKNINIYKKNYIIIINNIIINKSKIRKKIWTKAKGAQTYIKSIYSALYISTYIKNGK